MDKSIRVQVKEPCHENWQNMSPDEKGRFCGSCQKTVVDFTLMNDRQILDHLSKASGSTCGRFANDQLDRELKAEVVKPKSKWAYFINLLIPIFLSSSGSNNTKGEPSIISNVDKHPASEKSTDRIVGQISTIYCPSPIIIPDTTISEDVMGVIAIGPPTDCVSEEITVDTALKLNPPVITPGASTHLMGDTVLFDNTAVDTTALVCDLVGDLDIKSTKEERKPMSNLITDTLAFFGIKRPISAYPNPVIAGQSITIDFSPKTLGTYKLDVFDLNGKMIHSRQLNMVYPKQNFQIATDFNWSKGVYIIRLSGDGKDNVQSVKVMLR